MRESNIGNNFQEGGHRTFVDPAQPAIKLPERRGARGHGCRLLVLRLHRLWIELLQGSFGS